MRCVQDYAHHKACQGTDSSKPSIAGGNTAVSRGLEIGEKATNKIRRNIDYGETVHGCLPFLGHKGDKQSERISVAVLSVAREIAFANDVL